MFKLSWERFNNPGVIAGLIIIIFGFIVLCTADKINNFINSRFNIKRDCKLIIKLIAAALVVIGSLTAVFSI